MMKSLRLAVMIATGLAAGTVSADPYQRCVSMTEPLKRLDCYDTVAAEMRQTGDMQPVRSQRSKVAPTETPRLADEQFGLPPERKSKASSLTASVREVSLLPFGKLAIALDNGQNWQQVDNARLRLTPGERVVIRTAALGSHLLEKTSGSRRIRVRRVTD